MNLPGMDTECVICLSEFVPGERLRFLPKCNHGFHVRCIDKWLKSHSSCPKCRHCMIETCQKIMGCNQTSSSESSLPAQDSVVNIRPLEPESMVRDYRGWVWFCSFGHLRKPSDALKVLYSIEELKFGVWKAPNWQHWYSCLKTRQVQFIKQTKLTKKKNEAAVNRV